MTVLLVALLYVWGGWGLYVLLMAIYRLHLAKKLSGVSYVLAAPFVILGVTLDFVGNILCWALFADCPREWLISDRLRRYSATDKGWRGRVATWVCRNALDPFDAKSGEHC